MAETITLVRYKGSRESKAAHALAVEVGSALHAGTLARIHWTTPEDERAAFKYLERHADQEYSMVDCLSFVVMEKQGIREALGGGFGLHAPLHGAPGTGEVGVGAGRGAPGAGLVSFPKPQRARFEYNSLGKVTRETDPLGRVTIRNYYPNGIDLLGVRQSQRAEHGPAADPDLRFTTPAADRTDTSGQTTTYTYNAPGPDR